MSMLKYAIGLCAMGIALSSAARARADVVIEAAPLHDEKMRIDGLLREWPGQFASFKTTLKGSLKASGMVGYDDNDVYVAIKAADPKIVRSRGAGDDEDHATLSLAFPNTAGRYTAYEITLHPGDPGKLPGVVKVNGRVSKASKLVEAPEAGGLVIEAKIPWSEFSQSALARVGLKAALRYSDARAPGQIKNVVATSAKNGGSLPYLPLEGEQALRGALLKRNGLSDRPVRQVFGNVVGDSQYEWVAVYGQYLCVVGPGYRGGKEFYYGELNITSGKQLTRLELADLDADGKKEVLVQKQLGGDEGYREVLLAFKIDAKAAPSVVFAHEVGIVTEEGSIKNKVSISEGSITIAQGTSDGFDPATYDEPLPGEGVESALFPWDTVKSRSFEWKGDRMEPSDETAWKPKLGKPRGGGSRGRAASAPAGPPPPPVPRPPTSEELLDRVYALYKKDRGVGGAKPRFDFVTDVVGDPQTERVLVHGKDIVVFGKGFREGQSYTFINVGVKEDKDILHATARDLTGDGKAEIIVRGILKAKASKELGGDTIDRYALFIYGIQGEKLVRIFGAETGRALGSQRILGTVAFAPAKQGLSIELRPGRAVSWTEKDYPFPEDTTPAGGLEPLALPWGSLGARTYTFNGSSYSH
ncbi:MAG TPA: hypothetical protein VFU02_01970 [Polyangiaceae bacterium]|nr:hypothetical protein [Polyangiaceae bacterium]